MTKDYLPYVFNVVLCFFCGDLSRLKLTPRNNTIPYMDIWDQTMQTLFFLSLLPITSVNQGKSGRYVM